MPHCMEHAVDQRQDGVQLTALIKVCLWIKRSQEQHPGWHVFHP